jgi:hypothetical protein
MRQYFETDLRQVLPAIRVPTLVLAREWKHADEVKHVASQIPGAEFASLPGRDTMPWVGDQESVIEAIELFLAVLRPPPELDRVLATFLFTDIVDSTGRAADLGDSRWRTLLEDHNRIVREEISRYRGRELDTAGDGFFAVFDGPARAIRCAISNGVQTLGLDVRAGCTQASASCSATRWPGSQSRSGLELLGKRRPERCSSPAPSRTSSPGQESTSTIAEPPS